MTWFAAPGGGVSSVIEPLVVKRSLIVFRVFSLLEKVLHQLRSLAESRAVLFVNAETGSFTFELHWLTFSRNMWLLGGWRVGC